MLNIFKKFFDFNQREVERLSKRVDEINALEENAKKLKDIDFPKETAKLKKQIQSREKTLDDVLPWAYALVREAAHRSLGIRHFDVQLIAGIALNESKVVEQKTGEGKTLTATSPLYLNALTGKGVHLVTVNDYLARRDAGWMGKIFDFLGMSTAAIISDQSFLYNREYSDEESQDERLTHLKPASRKEAYDADITYGINSEFGFDYLRDNMAQSVDQLVQRGFYFAIIDEADSVLIDEARTPHIISAPYDQDTSRYYNYARIVRSLDPKTDYVVDEKLKTAHLTDTGIGKIEQALGVANIYERDFDTLFHIEASLKAETLFKLDKDYIVKDGEVIIVDEFTGRLLPGRRFSEGLHQAIEAKENVTIQRESKTLATVSLQNYFRMYEKLGGMTGTASTEAEEFHKIYKMDVVVIPTNRTMIRKDNADMIYKTERAKFNAVVEDIIEQYKKGRPVLVGTTSIDKNEYISRLLKQKGIPHELLNAKNHEREAHIISLAGEKGAITAATNMAGRGVDIILGGNQNEVKNQKLKVKSKKDDWNKMHDEVVELGGLYVIGTERHESRRIDNQLRGRAGRQGDPGETRFYVSLEDDLMRIFGGEQISNLMTAFNFPEDQPLSHALVSRAIEQAQVKVEGFNFDIRKHLVEYDDVLNKQREIVYTMRRKILTLLPGKQEEFKDTVFEIFYEQISALVGTLQSIHETMPDQEADNFINDINMLVPVDKTEIKKLLKLKNIEKVQHTIEKNLEDLFEQREKSLSKDVWYSIVQALFLQTIDQYWTEHLTAIEDLREGINLRGYAQMDPLVEYKNEAYSMFEKLLSDVNFEVMRRIFHMDIQIENKSPQKEDDSDSAKNVETSRRDVSQKKQNLPKPKQQKMEFKSASAIDPFAHSQQESQQIATTSDLTPADREYNKSLGAELGLKITPPGVQKPKLGRNDPCPCGSGKKWKKCHYPVIP